MSFFEMVLFSSMLGFFQVFFTWVLRLVFLAIISKAISKKIGATKESLNDTINKVKKGVQDGD